VVSYYVDGAVGNDSNTGLGEGAGLALATITAGMNKITAAGDRLHVKNSVVYNETVDMTNAVSGISNNPCILEGYQTTVGDKGRVILDGQSSIILGFTAPKAYWIVSNFTVRNYTSTGFYFGGQSRIAFYNCVSESNGGAAFQTNGADSYYRCETLNTANTTGVSTAASPTFVGCLFQNMGNKSISSSGPVILYKCLFTDTGVFPANHITDLGSIYAVINCTFDVRNAAAYAIRAHGWTQSGVVCDNIIQNSAGYSGVGAIDSSTSRYVPQQIIGNNLFYNNALGNYEFESDYNYEYMQDIPDADPLHVDTATYDYTLQSGSPAIGTGLPIGRIT
jgi:hypothetical protein